jgi:N-ethylmaleimide reductase
MENLKLFTPSRVGSIEVKNRIVMSPMTRCRAIGNIPNELMAYFYSARADAGLIITEGTAPSANGLGYARIPGVFSMEQVDGWKKVTTAVHKKGGKIFIQLMHTGRISHPLNMPSDSQIIAPSAIGAKGQMWTDSMQMQNYPVPKEMTLHDIIFTKAEYLSAAKNAMEAGFDGVELHGANGYLLEQFISPVSNVRKDKYGGSIENRCQFVIEVVNSVAKAIGKDKTGIRISPYGVTNDMPIYPEIDQTYKYLSEKLNALDIAYIHQVDHSSMGGPVVPMEIKKMIRAIFKNSIILSGGYSLERAEVDLDIGLGDMIAFGRPFINNPDLVKRLEKDLPLSENLRMDMFYTEGKEGYTDYPKFKAELV